MSEENFEYFQKLCFNFNASIKLQKITLVVDEEKKDFGVDEAGSDRSPLNYEYKRNPLLHPTCIT